MYISIIGLLASILHFGGWAAVSGDQTISSSAKSVASVSKNLPLLLQPMDSGVQEEALNRDCSQDSAALKAVLCGLLGDQDARKNKPYCGLASRVKCGGGRVHSTACGPTIILTKYPTTFIDQHVLDSSRW